MPRQPTSRILPWPASGDQQTSPPAPGGSARTSAHAGMFAAYVVKPLSVRDLLSHAARILEA